MRAVLGLPVPPHPLLVIDSASRAKRDDLLLGPVSWAPSVAKIGIGPERGTGGDVADRAVVGWTIASKSTAPRRMQMFTKAP